MYIRPCTQAHSSLHTSIFIPAYKYIRPCTQACSPCFHLCTQDIHPCTQTCSSCIQVYTHSAQNSVKQLQLVKYIQCFGGAGEENLTDQYLFKMLLKSIAQNRVKQDQLVKKTSALGAGENMSLKSRPQGRVKKVQFGEKDQCSGLMVKKTTWKKQIRLVKKIATQNKPLQSYHRVHPPKPERSPVYEEHCSKLW